MIVTQNSSNIPALQIDQVEKEGYLFISQPQPPLHIHHGYHHDGYSASCGEDTEQISKHEFAIRFFDQSCANEHGLANGKTIVSFFKDCGLLFDDPRLQKLFALLQDGEHAFKTNINLTEFLSIIRDSEQGVFLENAFRQNLIIPDFKSFTCKVKTLFDQIRTEIPQSHGKLASYIPQLAKVDRNLYGLSFCSIDGQRFHFGDAKTRFCIQSCIKPITYGMALEEHGEKYVHEHIGREPSGVTFNSLCLNPQNLPHNPLINSGAIMACALIGSGKKMSFADKFSAVMDKCQKLSGGFDWGFSNSIYLSEKETADSNICLAYMMKGSGSLPPNTDIQQTLEYYFQCCSLQTDCSSLAILGATIANGGVCPITKERVFKTETCRSMLSQMYSSGMYDYSGEWAYVVGIPAKSGVSGAIYAIIPDFGCFSIYSPALDTIGNSVRGVDFFKKLVKEFVFHTFDSTLQVQKESTKCNPRKAIKEDERLLKVNALYACAEGDLSELKQLIVAGVSPNTSDYDGRTLLHLACSEGHKAIVKFLLQNPDTLLSPFDRWKQTPLDDARTNGHESIAVLLSSRIDPSIS